jgi:two-component system, NtrC family, nitrogen regulation sensor histidine kinase NtrY
MASKHTYWLLSCVIFALIGIYLDYSPKEEILPDHYVPTINQYLRTQEAEAVKWIKDKDFVQWQYLGFDKASSERQKELNDKLSTLIKKPYTIFFYRGDSLMFWTNTKTPPVKTDTTTQTAFVTIGNTIYERIYQPITQLPFKQAHAQIYIPIQHKYAFESNFFKDTFLADVNIPTAAFSLQPEPSSAVITNINGQTLCYLHGKITNLEKNTYHLVWMLLAYLCSFFSFCSWLDRTVRHIVRETRAIEGSVILAASIFAVILMATYFNFTDRFSTLGLFKRNFEDTSMLGNSLGDLLINIVLLLWLMIFFHREFEIIPLNKAGKIRRYFSPIFSYWSMILGVIMVAHIFQGLILNSKIVFDFDNVFNLNRYSFIALIGVQLLLIAFFLFTHRMMLMIHGTGLSRNVRFALLLISLCFSAPFFLDKKLSLPLESLIPATIMYIVLFDYFVTGKGYTIHWIAIWLSVFSALSSALLYKYNNDKEERTQITYARTLAEPQDTLAEKAIFTMLQRINATIHTPQNVIINDTMLSKICQEEWRNTYYLRNNYQNKMIWLNENMGVEDTVLSLKKRVELLTKNRQVTAIVPSEVDFWAEKNGKIGYTAYMVHQNKRLALEITCDIRQSKQIYPRILPETPFKNLDQLHRFRYAVYRNGNRTISATTFGHDLQPPKEKMPNPGETSSMMRSDNILQSHYDKLSYLSKDGTTLAVVDKEVANIFKSISLFCYLFTAQTIITLFLFWMNNIIKALPNTASSLFEYRSSLSGRIQSYVIYFSLGSFLLITTISAYSFSESSKKNNQTRLESRVSPLLKDAEKYLLQSTVASAQKIESLVQEMSEIHGIDINFYNAAGKLVTSSEKYLLDKQIITPLLSPVTYINLAKMNLPSTKETQSIGSLQYSTVVVPIKNYKNQIQGFLEIPYYTEQIDGYNDLLAFIGTLLNAYVFMLLIAVAIAVAAAASVTKPLEIIGEKLRQFKLGGRNEPLEYQWRDELGQLIEAYNSMISKLENSLEMLSQNQREYAWREMAKQVAHEIKNPLTPMKLNLYYLEHAYSSSPDADAKEALVKRFSRSLIEQIDSLAQTASEFSSYTKMPKATAETLVINDLVVSNHNLFNTPDNEVQYELFLCPEKLSVLANRTHLNRVLVNLMKNAIQAIPHDRRGRIEIHLYEEEDFAVVKVSDNGNGIAPDARDKIFSPNFTTKSTGSGLGLAMSKNIIESLEGQIYFETQVGEGTDFYIKLPLIRMVETEADDDIYSRVIG